MSGYEVEPGGCIFSRGDSQEGCISLLVQLEAFYKSIQTLVGFFDILDACQPQLFHPVALIYFMLALYTPFRLRRVRRYNLYIQLLACPNCVRLH